MTLLPNLLLNCAPDPFAAAIKAAAGPDSFNTWFPGTGERLCPAPVNCPEPEAPPFMP